MVKYFLRTMNNKKIETELFFIIKQFMCCTPINKFKWKDFFKNVARDTLEVLVRDTVNSTVLKKFPIKPSYQIAFVKTVIDLLEKENVEADDCVFDALGRLMALSTPEFHFKHFIFEHEQDTIILKESTNIISEGTTGLSVWEASLALSQWCLTKKELLEGKNILELGAGLGLTGITISRFCLPTRLFLTDGHPLVLKLLCENVKQNLQDTFVTSENYSDDCRVMQKFKNDFQEVEILKLLWEEIDEKLCQNLKVNFIFAADIIYDSSLFPALISAIKLFIDVCNARAIFACTQRNEDTLNEFLHSVADNSLSLTELDIPEQKDFIWQSDIPVKIFCIH